MRTGCVSAGFATKEGIEAKIHELAVLLDTVQLNKADASIVAGKAEREYVENALEKLRREVEQVCRVGLYDLQSG